MAAYLVLVLYFGGILIEHAQALLRNPLDDIVMAGL